jgi:ribosomal protein L7/L12
MVDDPEVDKEAYLNVEKIMMEEALSQGLSLKEAKRQVEKLLSPVVNPSAKQEPPPKAR